MSKVINAKFFWKGRRVTEKVYNDRVRLSKVGKNLRAECKATSNLNKAEPEIANPDVLDGRRIIHLKSLGKALFCRKCKAVLSILDAMNEKRSGLFCVFTVKCRNCPALTQVACDKSHTTHTQAKTGRKVIRYDVNTRAALGTINAGIGNQQLNKVLASFNIPPFHPNTHRTHEEEIGVIMKELSDESCNSFAQLERELTIQNVERVKALLPSHLSLDFIFPDVPDVNNNFDPNKITAESIVRFIGIYDMGWPTRGTGRDYNSYTGTGALIGYFTGKVIAFVSYHRKCRKCDLGHGPKDHDCKLNFEGSAKAMEPKAAAALAKSQVLQDCNMQLGILIGDNDSSAIAAVRSVLSHEVIKHSDKNHTGKGVTNELYKIKKDHKELTADAIQFLTRCFSYAVSQNAGDVNKMSQAVKNIPHHCFNDHQNCGDWCDYHKDPENYKHSIIGDGFQNQKLFEALTCLFDVLANRAHRYAAGVSSNSNDNFNNTIASKAPKSRYYGGSNSYDIRLQCAVNKKNEGEKFVQISGKKLLLSPGTHTRRYADRVDRKAKKRYSVSQTTIFKKNRLRLKKKKKQLRNRKEKSEGPNTYRSNMGLLEMDTPAVDTTATSSTSRLVVYFDIETGGLSKTSPILQLAFKCGLHTFSIYALTTERVDERASQVTGLRMNLGKLEYNGVPVPAVTLSEALQKSYEFLKGLSCKCVLVAHNCAFDRTRMIAAIRRSNLVEQYASVVHGFVDSLPLIKKITGRTKKGENKLENLGASFGISTSNAHNALDDVIILEQVMKKLSIGDESILESVITWDEAMKRVNFSEELPIALPKLSKLDGCTSLQTRKKIVAAGISYEMILTNFNNWKMMGLLNLFGEDENGCVRVSKNRGVIQKIFKFLTTLQV